MRPTILALGIAAASLLLVAPFENRDRFRRPLPAGTLSIVRGADNGSPSATIRHCDDQNTGPGEVGWWTGCYSPGVNEQTVCVQCAGDNASARTTAAGATGSNFLPDDYYNCSGNKQIGTCKEVMPGRFDCFAMPWDGHTTCSGAIYQTLQQVPHPAT